MINIILGGKSNALAIARSLFDGKSDIHVFTIDGSKVCKYSKCVDVYSCFSSSDEVLDVLKGYDTELIKIIYPTSDLWASFLSRNEKILKARGFFFRVPSHDKIDFIIDKFLFYKKLNKKTLMPWTSLASSELPLIKNESYILKPRKSFYGDFIVGKGFREDLKTDKELIVQEKLSLNLKDHFSISGISENGRIIFLGITNKVLEYPSPGGTATLVISSKLSESIYNQAVDIANIVISTLEYDGVFEIELIWHKGRFFLLELNPRFWLQHDIFSKLGVNVSRMYMDLCLGNPVEPVTIGSDQRLAWLHEGVLVSLFKSKFKLLELMRIIFRYRITFAHWNFLDIKPFFVFVYGVLCKRK